MLVETGRRGLVSGVLVFLLSGLAVWLTAAIVPGVHVDTFWPDAVIAALVLGLLNALVRPLLVVLTLPVTVVTLGLFLLVVNAAVLGLGAAFLDGLRVDGFGAALMGAVVLSLVSGLLSRLARAPDEA